MVMRKCFNPLQFFIVAIVAWSPKSLHAGKQFSLPLDCSNFTDKDFPSVRVYDSAPDVPIYYNTSLVLEKPQGDTKGQVYGWIGVECRHTKPVRWLYDQTFELLDETYSNINREWEDFYDTSSYSFTAEIQVKLRSQGQRVFMACVTFDHPCEQRIAETSFQGDDERYLLRLLPKNEEINSSVPEFVNAMVRSSAWEGPLLDDETNCSVNFTLVDYGDNYLSTFEPIGSVDIKPKSLPDSQSLQNAYLFTETVSRKCTFRSNCYVHVEAFKQCSKTLKVPQAKYWPILFYMTIPERNISRVVRVYHTSVTRNSTNDLGEGVIKQLWEYSKPTDFLVMEELPRKLALEKPVTNITIKCHSSPYFFSFGTIIGYKFMKTPNEKLIILSKEDMIDDPGTGADVLDSGVISIPFTGEEINVTFYCIAPVWNSSTEWVNVSRNVELKMSSLQVSGNGMYFDLPVNSTFNTTCTATGHPVPEIKINPPRQYTRFDTQRVVTDESVEETIILTNVDESHAGFYNCVASNYAGTDYYGFEIRIRRPKTDVPLSRLVIILISVFGSLSAIFLAVVVILLIKYRMEKEEFRRLTEEAIREFFDGLDAVKHGFPADQDLDINDHFYVNDSIKTIPYDRKFEVPQKQWSFNNDSLLGTGAFGVVRRGTVDFGSRKSIVAIKTVKSPDDIEHFRATLLELKIMAHIGDHQNIVRLIAASTEEIQSRKVFIGVEFCPNGNLLEYLHKRKKLFNNLVDAGQIQFPSKCADTTYMNVEECKEQGKYLNLVTSDMSTIDLFKWSYQIASGMNFLESKNVLHADLAARNVLLSENLEAKIGDFGLSRELFENSEYTKKTQVALPWKWMAIESLRFLKFSTKSDVWSFGVTLHEIFTLGEEPYPGQVWSEEFITTLENGMRLDRPSLCTDNVYNQVMQGCWRSEPNDRISFADAMNFFEKAIGLLTSSPRNDDECRDFC